MNTPDTEWERIVKIAYGTDMQGKHYVDLQDLRPVFDKILTSHTTYWKEQLQKTRKEERERIIYITKNIKDAFMSPLTERRWLQCIQFKDQPKPKDHSELDQSITNEDNLK